jgi:hypothetical protein
LSKKYPTHDNVSFLVSEGKRKSQPLTVKFVNCWLYKWVLIVNKSNDCKWTPELYLFTPSVQIINFVMQLIIEIYTDTYVFMDLNFRNIDIYDLLPTIFIRFVFYVDQCLMVVFVSYFSLYLRFIHKMWAWHLKIR